MKTILSLLLIITLPNLTIAQNTAIPDANFEQSLINMGLDGTIDGVVLTANIDTLTSLNVNSQNINDLTGIQDFTALTYLGCRENQLTNLDVTQNNALTYLACEINQITNLNVTQNTALSTLYCGANPLTNLDVTQNSALTFLNCAINQLTSLDVTQNSALTYLNCRENQLTSLDITQNSALIFLGCSENQLTNLDLTQNSVLTQLFCNFNQLSCLNVKNHNTNFIVFFAIGNPNLTCIDVDNVAFSTANWSTIDLDVQTSFSTNCNNSCSSVGIKEAILSDISIYPNPTTGNFTIDLGEIKEDVKATLTNGLGQLTLIENYNSTNLINLDINAPKGIYFLQIEIDGDVITKRIINE
tara:strand:- start:137 stop:1207 length:1071 start_codon:yes stop_codon:yes gene_type:complete